MPRHVVHPAIPPSAVPVHAINNNYARRASLLLLVRLDPVQGGERDVSPSSLVLGAIGAPLVVNLIHHNYYNGIPALPSSAGSILISSGVRPAGTPNTAPPDRPPDLIRRFY